MIKRAYRKQSLRYHPDRVSAEEAEEAAEKFVAIKVGLGLGLGLRVRVRVRA